MRRILTIATAAMIAVAGTVLVAQKVTTPAELDAAMKKIGPAQGAAGKAIQSGSFADAKAQVAIVKATLMGAQNFWEINKKDDAIAFSKDSIAEGDGRRGGAVGAGAGSAGCARGVEGRRRHLRRVPQDLSRAG
jgi:hypothetical protein